MELKVNLTNQQYKDLETYCKLNNLNLDDVVKKSYQQGIKIEMYGLLSGGADVVEKEVIKYVEVPKETIKIEYVEVEKPVEKIVEIIKEIPIETIIEKEVIKEVPVEKIVEIIKEIPVDKIVIKEVINEVPVEKIVYITDQKELEEKIFQKDQEFEEERRKFSTKMDEMENIFQKEKDNLSLKIKELENKEPEVVEIIKEVQVEKVVVDDTYKPKMEALQSTIQKLKQDNIDKDKKIAEYEKMIKDLNSFQQEKKAIYLRGSNLDDIL